jgi:molybdate/tungstate transport system substrate-binding protein
MLREFSLLNSVVILSGARSAESKDLHFQRSPFLKLNLTLSFFAAVALAATAPAESPQVVIIDRAATLTLPFDALAKTLPQLECRQRSAGSRFLLHSDVDLKQPVDVLALADVSLFEKPVSPAQTARFPWWSIFAGNEIVNASNWPQILQQPGVQTAYADPESDPEGYNTVIAWTLAESYYHLPGFAAKLRAAIPQKNIRGDSTQLLALLSAGEVDYAWEYRSVAEQHHLKFLRLPKEINLSDPALAAIYKTACIDLHHIGPNGEKVAQPKCGQPILYAVAIAADAPHPQAAAEFVKALYSEAGKKALESAFQEPLPAQIGGNLNAAPNWLTIFIK